MSQYKINPNQFSNFRCVNLNSPAITSTASSAQTNIPRMSSIVPTTPSFSNSLTKISTSIFTSTPASISNKLLDISKMPTSLFSTLMSNSNTLSSISARSTFTPSTHATFSNSEINITPINNNMLRNLENSPVIRSRKKKILTIDDFDEVQIV